MFSLELSKGSLHVTDLGLELIDSSQFLIMEISVVRGIDLDSLRSSCNMHLQFVGSNTFRIFERSPGLFAFFLKIICDRKFFIECFKSGFHSLDFDVTFSNKELALLSFSLRSNDKVLYVLLDNLSHHLLGRPKSGFSFGRSVLHDIYKIT